MNVPCRCRFLILALCFFITLPCSAPGAGEKPESPGTAEEKTAEAGLLPVPHPDLTHLEAAVGEQLRGALAVIDSVMSSTASESTLRSQAFADLGHLYHAYELYDAAEPCYRNAVTLDPTRFEWKYSLGYLLQKLGRNEEGIRLFQRALIERPDSSLAYIRLGESYRSLGLLQEAKEAFEAAYRLEPEEPAILARLGETALEEKKFDKAVEYLEKALTRQPAANKLHYPLAMAYRGLGKTESARDHLARRGMVGIQPFDPLRNLLGELVKGARVHQLTGRLAYAAGRYVEAESAFEKAVTADPGSAGARVNLGTALAKQSRYKDAIGQFEEAVRLAPDNVAAHFNLGSLYSHLGESEKAVSHMAEVVTIQPDDPQAHLGLARALQRTGEFGKAFEHYKASVRLDPQEAAGWLEMSSLLYLAGQYEEALQVIEEGRERLPHQTSIAHGLARFLASSPDSKLRDGSRALELSLEVFESHLNFEYARTVAMAYAELGRCADAVEWQDRAIAMAADSGVADQFLARLKQNLSHYRNGPPCTVPAGDVEADR